MTSKLLKVFKIIYYNGKNWKLKSFILSWEGGFVNDPRDPGGTTNKGITIVTFRSVFGKDKNNFNTFGKGWLRRLNGI